jgi:hypothetical protein
MLRNCAFGAYRAPTTNFESREERFQDTVEIKHLKLAAKGAHFCKLEKRGKTPRPKRL